MDGSEPFSSAGENGFLIYRKLRKTAHISEDTLQNISQRQSTEHLSGECAQRAQSQRGERAFPQKQMIQAGNNQLAVELRLGKENAYAPAQKRTEHGFRFHQRQARMQFVAQNGKGQRLRRLDFRNLCAKLTSPQEIVDDICLFGQILFQQGEERRGTFPRAGQRVGMRKNGFQLGQPDDIILCAGIQPLRIDGFKRIAHAANAPKGAHGVVIAQRPVPRSQSVIQRQQPAQRM